MCGHILVVRTRPALPRARRVRISAAMPYTHLTLSSEGRHPLCPEEPARRALLHVIGRVAAGHVVLFALVDDHLHLVLAGTDAVLARLRQAVTLAVRAAVGIPLEPPYSRPVQTQIGRAHV